MPSFIGVMQWARSKLVAQNQFNFFKVFKEFGFFWTRELFFQCDKKSYKSDMCSDCLV